MSGPEIAGLWEEDKGSPRSDSEKLDRALVAGLMLEVILETSGSPGDPRARRRLVKARLQDTIVTQLAGRVTLDRFRHLLRKVDHWFPLYYPLINAAPPEVRQAGTPQIAPALPPRRALREDLLQAWFKQKAGDLLPRRPHRKLHPDKLREFLHRTQGCWFRLKVFEQHFGVDRKTAWEYLQKLLHARLLRHNQGRSAAARYALEIGFLVVRGDILEPRVAAALSGLPQSLAGQVSQWLIATGGEAFWDKEWQGGLEPFQCQDLTTRLKGAGLLEVTGQNGVSEQFRLPRCWLQL